MSGQEKFFQIPTFVGEKVILEPLSLEHTDALREAVQDGNIHKLWYTQVPSPENMEEGISWRLQQHAEGFMVPWVIKDKATGNPIGMTTFVNIRADHARLEIGYTWMAKSFQRSGINTEMKLLLLQYAFEDLKCIAVEFRTHWHNHQSREAIAKLGAKQDGVLRNHDRWADGSVRDLVVFSIIDREWETVKISLRTRLAYHQ